MPLKCWWPPEPRPTLRGGPEGSRLCRRRAPSTPRGCPRVRFLAVWCRSALRECTSSASEKQTFVQKRRTSVPSVPPAAALRKVILRLSAWQDTVSGRPHRLPSLCRRFCEITAMAGRPSNHLALPGICLQERAPLLTFCLRRGNSQLFPYVGGWAGRSRVPDRGGRMNRVNAGHPPPPPHPASSLKIAGLPLAFAYPP